MQRQVVITGANRGIGLAFTQHYCEQGAAVTAICRESSAELEALPCKIISQIDFHDSNAANKVADQLGATNIDILINNAGIFCNETLELMDFDQILEQININAIAPLKLSHRLLSNLQPGSKIINITSRMGSMADNGSGSYYGYRASKAALNAFGKSLAMDLQQHGIMVAQLHPGFVSTRMVGFNGDITPEEAVAGLTQRIEELNPDNSGSFWHAQGELLPW